MVLVCENKIADFWKTIIHNKENVWLNVTTASMVPLIPEGGRILVRSLGAKKIKLGDIVLFSSGNNFVVHRVLFSRYNKGKFLQCGDCSAIPSYIAINNIIGIIERAESTKEHIDFTTSSMRLINKTLSIFSLLIILLRRIYPKSAILMTRIKILILILVIKMTKSDY